MIKMSIDKGRVSGSIQGNLQDLCAETIVLVKHVHKGIEDQNKEAAVHYANMISRAFDDGIVFNDKKLEDVVKEMCLENDDDEDNEDEEENAGFDALDGLFGDAVESLEKIMKKLEELTK